MPARAAKKVNSPRRKRGEPCNKKQAAQPAQKEGPNPMKIPSTAKKGKQE